MKITFKAHTFVEAVVAIGMILILSGTLFFSLFSISKLTEASQKVLSENRSLLSMAYQLEKLVNEVQVPWWAPWDKIIEKNSEGVVIHYRQGEEEDTLGVTIDGPFLKIESAVFSAQWGPFTELKVDIWKKEDRPVGVLLSFKKDNKPITLKTAFGSQAL